MLERGHAVGHPLREVELRDHPERGLEARLVVVGLPVGLDAPEHVGRGDDVAEVGEALGHGADVGADAEDLLDEQHAGARPGLREPDLQVERAAVDGDLVGAVVGMGGIIARGPDIDGGP